MMTEAVAGGQSLTVSALQDLYDRMNAVSIMVAVWCVDRPDAFWRVRQLFRDPVPNLRPYNTLVPIYEWYSRFADDANWARRPECFHTPGVYMQMNTGIYLPVDL